MVFFLSLYKTNKDNWTPDRRSPTKLGNWEGGGGGGGSKRSPTKLENWEGGEETGKGGGGETGKGGGGGS